ncbi:myelin expression factor 2 [Daphnia magna]|uniref:Uncharacterized protein n=2 Tax=Daphnia magna TaxID=35525 RepID=A0ABR0ASY4_9CRUS|nr:myelin expression factor 2 [Daphnia magna]KAK4028165.1 hypothetical protein OUZ56_017425 [Daphnia magna]KZS10977.1 putative Myelin expression factor 2 [Daphnia magna]
MDNTANPKENERSCGVPKAGEDMTTVLKKNEATTDRPTQIEKSSGKKKSQDREQEKSRDRQSVREHHRRGERSRGGGRAASKGSIYRPRSRPECRVHISNIPYEYRWQDLKDLFRNEVGEVSFVELFEDERGKPRGCGIVEFEKIEHARIALDKMNRYELKGRRLIVKEDFDIEGDGYGHLRGASASISSRQESERHIPRSYSSGRDYVGDVSYDGMRSGRGSINGTLASPSSTRWSNTYGLSPQFLDSLGISGPLFDRIFVANLDYKVDDAKLREVFGLAGKVVDAEVVKDRDGRSRGFGVLKMSHPVEAVQAISMFNNQMLFDRRMTVRMDRDADRTETRASRCGLPEGLRSIGMGLGSRGDPLHDVPRGGLQDRPLDLYRNSSTMEFGSFGSRIASASDDFVPSSNTSLGHASGMSAMGSQVEQSVAGLHSIRSSRPMHDPPMGDYRMNNMESGYNVRASSGNSISLNRIADSYNPASYGYRTESVAAKDIYGTSILDYERRDLYTNNGTNQLTRETQDYLSTSAGYASGTRMPGMGSSVSSSLPLGPSDSSSRSSDTIVITNLPPNCTWQDLRDKFCEVGDVLFADIRAKGTGLVRFSSERDAQRACAVLNRTNMEGYAIEVNFY